MLKIRTTIINKKNILNLDPKFNLNFKKELEEISNLSKKKIKSFIKKYMGNKTKFLEKLAKNLKRKKDNKWLYEFTEKNFSKIINYKKMELEDLKVVSLIVSKLYSKENVNSLIEKMELDKNEIEKTLENLKGN